MINIITQVTDRVTPALRKISGKVNRETKRMAAVAERNASRAGLALKRAFSGGLASVAAFAGPLALGLAIKKTIDFAKDAAETANKIKVVFGPAAEKMTEDLKNAATQFGTTSQEAGELAAQLGILAQAQGVTKDKSADMSVALVQAATDVGSLQNAAASEVLQAFQSALTGMALPARRFGIVLSDVLVQQEALNSGLVKNKKEITEAVKFQARYNLILKGAEVSAGDFARTSGDLANSTRILVAQIEELAGEIGEALIPVATTFVGNMRDLVGWFRDLGDTTLEKQIRELKELGAGAEFIAKLNRIVAINKALDKQADITRKINSEIDRLNFGTVAIRAGIMTTNEEQNKFNEGIDRALRTLVTEAATAKDLAPLQATVNEWIAKRLTLVSQLADHESGILTLDDNIVRTLTQMDEVLSEAITDANTMLGLRRQVLIVEQSIADATDDTSVNTTVIGQRLLDLIPITGELRTRSEQIGEEWGTIPSTIKGVKENVQELNFALNTTIGFFDAMILPLHQKWFLATQAIKGQAESIAMNVGNVLVDGLVRSIGHANELKDILKDVASSLAKLALELGIRAGLQAVTGLPFLSFQHGGRPPVGQASLVGERGPELFVPDQAGTIISNHNLGGNTINFNLPNVSTGQDARELFQEFQRLMKVDGYSFA